MCAQLASPPPPPSLFLLAECFLSCPLSPVTPPALNLSEPFHRVFTCIPQQLHFFFFFFSFSFFSSSSSLFLYLRGDVGEEEEEKVNESFTCTHVALLALFSFRSASPLLPLNSYLIAPPPSYYYQISRFALIFSFTRESDPEIRKPRVFVTDNKHIPGPTRLFGLLINFFFLFLSHFHF